MELRLSALLLNVRSDGGGGPALAVERAHFLIPFKHLLGNTDVNTAHSCTKSVVLRRMKHRSPSSTPLVIVQKCAHAR